MNHKTKHIGLINEILARQKVQSTKKELFLIYDRKTNLQWTAVLNVECVEELL